LTEEINWRGENKANPPPPKKRKTQKAEGGKKSLNLTVKSFIITLEVNLRKNGEREEGLEKPNQIHLFMGQKVK